MYTRDGTDESKKLGFEESWKRWVLRVRPAGVRAVLELGYGRLGWLSSYRPE